MPTTPRATTAYVIATTLQPEPAGTTPAPEAAGSSGSGFPALIRRWTLPSPAQALPRAGEGWALRHSAELVITTGPRPFRESSSSPGLGGSWPLTHRRFG